MLTTYQEVRDRIIVLARQHGLRLDWVETTRYERLVHLYDSAQILVARGRVPLRDVTAGRLEDLRHDLEHLFGKDWME